MNSNTRVLTCMPGMLVLLMFSLAAGAFAQEHPEHPKEGAKKAAVTVTKEAMAEAIESYIKKDSALKGGYFTVYDALAKAPLALKLDKVHQDKLAKVSEGLYFACSDFKAADGKVYDLDFFMKGGHAGLEVSEVLIHKESGNPPLRLGGKRRRLDTQIEIVAKNRVKQNWIVGWMDYWIVGI